MRGNELSSVVGAGLGIIGFLIVIFFSGIIGAFLWPFVINSWLIYTGGKAAIVWWQGFLLGFVPYFGSLSIPAAIFTWLLMLFL